MLLILWWFQGLRMVLHKVAGVVCQRCSNVYLGCIFIKNRLNRYEHMYWLFYFPSSELVKGYDIISIRFSCASLWTIRFFFQYHAFWFILLEIIWEMVREFLVMIINSLLFYEIAIFSFVCWDFCLLVRYSFNTNWAMIYFMLVHFISSLAMIYLSRMRSNYSNSLTIWTYKF